MRFVRFILLFFYCLISGHLMAEESLSENDSSRATYYLELSFYTDPIDSIIYLLDQAIVHANTEGNVEVYLEALMEKALVYKKALNGDSSNYYYELSLTEARKMKPTTSSLAMVYQKYGINLGYQNEYFAALSYLDTAAILYLSIQDTLSYADVISMKGAVHDNSGSEGKALRMYLEASRIYENYHDSAVFAGTISNVAIVFKKLGDYEGALENYNKSLDILSGMNDTLGMATTKVNRGMLYKELGMLDEALLDVRESLSVFQKENVKYGIAIAHHNLAEIHLLMRNLDSVLYHVDESQKIAIDLKFWLTVVSNNVVLTKALQDLGRPELSVKTAKRAYAMSLEHGFLEKQEELAVLLASNYEQLGNFELALNYYKNFKAVRDSLLNKESQEQINRLRTEYDVEQKEENIRDLQLINSYQMSLAEKEEKLKHVLVIGILLSLLVMILFLYLYRRQRKFSKELSAQKVQLTGLNKEKDDLIAMVAHDLRSPLNNIKGLLGIIKDSEESDRVKMVELANQSTDVLRNRINQILDVEAINVGKINLKITDVNVFEILKQLTRHISPEADKKQISFFTNSLKTFTCRADENYLLQVLENLCINAVKFSKQQSEIYVKVTANDGKIKFEVQDQGQGIPKDEIENLFTRYAKISTLPTENETSTGLGLPIVKKYVEAMGGRVWCESQVGVGSSFYVVLQSGN